MERVPNDLNNIATRNEYLKNHKTWFLKYHPDAIKTFEDEVTKKYGITENIKKSELELFSDFV